MTIRHIPAIDALQEAHRHIMALFPHAADDMKDDIDREHLIAGYTLLCGLVKAQKEAAK